VRSLYEQHLAERQRLAEENLAATGHDALLLHSGRPLRYFADDQDAPFRPTPHFAHWVPLDGPEHLLLVRPGERPRLVRYAPEDYWYEQAPLGDPFWADAFDLVEVASVERAWAEASAGGRVAYVGNAPDEARARGIEAANPDGLVARLDWDRSYKSAYEVECTAAACERAARGHLAARDAFRAGGSELDVHRAFVRAVGGVEAELPYPTIVGLDAKGAVLHYTGKRATRDDDEGRVLLIDAGARCNGYASDVTRTWTAEDCDPAFRALAEGVDRLQRELCDRVRPGLAYPDLHHAAHVLVGDLLAEVGIARIGGEEAVERGLTPLFLPHGLGHFLGLQVHDVAGHQRAREGGTAPPPDRYPFLRTTRTIEERQVFTVEPGVYFIELLLRDARADDRAGLLDWELVERCLPLGGIRVEDDVVVTADGHRNLSRPHLD